MKTCFCLFLCLALLPSCGMFSQKSYTVPQQWIMADRATFDVVAPTLRLFADNDPSNDPNLSGINGPAVLQLIDAWEARLMAAEAQLAWMQNPDSPAFR